MSLMTKHRPMNFKDVYGHNQVKEVLMNKLNTKDHPHVFLFAGPSGIGKTTFARIIANKVNAEVIEFDAGNLTGVDAIRDLIGTASTISITGKANKCFIVDECHMLSKNAWNALLKTIEEPGKYTYFVFCTTELNKVPAAIKNQRAISFTLTSLHADDIFNMLENIHEDDRMPEVYNSLISRNCDGSPRQALNMLEIANSLKDFDEFKKAVNDGIHEKMEESVLNICRELVKTTPAIKSIVTNLKNVANYEGARIQIFNYLTAVCMNKPDLLERLICLSDPIYSNTTGKGELLIKLLMAKRS